MRVVVLKPLHHDRLGSLRKGTVVDMDDRWAGRYLARGAVERYETKVVREAPLLDAGEVGQSFASPAAQVSRSEMSKPYARGGKRRKEGRSS